MISICQLSRLIAPPDAPVLIAVRIDEDHALAPRMVPCAALLAVFRFKAGVIPTLLACSVAGIVLHFVGVV
jgi:hypothetical protein